MKGCVNLRKKNDTRLPITKDILSQIVVGMEKCIQNFFNRVLLKSVFLLAFHAFLRLGEILTRSPTDSQKVLQVQDTYLTFSGNTPVNLTITLRSFKNMKLNQPVTICIDTNLRDPNMCPVAAFINYRNHFKHTTGPLFQFMNGTTVSHNFVVHNLDSILKFIGLNSKLYKGHSFRIGAATHAATLGFSDDQIRRLGRWNSNALEHYIRISSFHAKCWLRSLDHVGAKICLPNRVVYTTNFTVNMTRICLPVFFMNFY